MLLPRIEVGGGRTGKLDEVIRLFVQVNESLQPLRLLTATYQSCMLIQTHQHERLEDGAFRAYRSPFQEWTLDSTRRQLAHRQPNAS